MTSSLRRRLAATTLAALLLPAGGCGLGAGDPPAGVQLTITRNGGTKVIRDDRRPRVDGQDTVLRLLQRNAKISTRYSGALVDAIDGVSGGERGWFYWVDGVAADRGAASWQLRDGDRVWWDLPELGQGSREISAVIGAFPAPLVGGFDGRSQTVWARCAEPGRRACTLVRERLAAVGARFATEAEQALEAGDRRAPVRVVVGRPEQLGQLSEEASKITTEGLGEGAGMIAALRRAPHPPVWVITGADDQGVRRAAKALDEASLRHRIAVTIDQRGIHPLTRPPQ